MSNRFFYYREKSHFEKPGVDEDVANLRFKHYQARLIDLINELLFERKKIVEVQKKLDNRNQTFRSNSPGFPAQITLNQDSQAQISRSPGSNLNLQPRPSQKNVFSSGVTPARRPSQMNDDIGLGGGSAFLTDLKKPSSRMNINSQSPDGRASAARLNGKGSAGDMSPNPQGSFMNPGMLGSPSSTGQNMLVSFNFLTQVPIEEFVI